MGSLDAVLITEEMAWGCTGNSTIHHKILLIDWLIDWSIDWSIDQLTDWLLDWLIDSWFVWWLDWLIDCLIELAYLEFGKSLFWQNLIGLWGFCKYISGVSLSRYHDRGLRQWIRGKIFFTWLSILIFFLDRWDVSFMACFFVFVLASTGPPGGQPWTKEEILGPDDRAH